MANLVIVESPTKAGTIKGYLGSNYKVLASKGHVRDLPKSKFGIDVENDFKPEYINIRGKADLIKLLKKEGKAAAKIYLATDPDREGEAISWHLAQVLSEYQSKISRVTFNEITKSSVRSAIKNARDIDGDLVNSQQTRRLLDRIVGYKLSPFLWKNVKHGLSAGRVQSVATRLIVEREEEIKNFKPEEYWEIEGKFMTPRNDELTAKYYSQVGKRRENITSGERAAEVANDIMNGSPAISSVKKSVKHRSPAPPFTTSSMQQEANRRLNFNSQKTMKVAQELYEGINLGAARGGTQGLITYMRTDSLRISNEAAVAAKEFIVKNFGEKYAPDKFRVYKMRANAQDAHEAIRPSDINLTPEDVKANMTYDQYKLYKLIWDRFVASQMENAEYDTVAADIVSGNSLLKASGSSIRFPGFLSVYEELTDDKAEEKQCILPKLIENDALKTVSVEPSKHFTEPPLRYTEASLIKALEEKGIGRPSTYTPTITTIIQRDYVERAGKSLKPTALGEVTTNVMRENFPDIISYEFTANMENDLDDISVGKKDYKGVLRDFYSGFEKDLKKANETMDGKSVQVPEKECDIICDKCGAHMVIKKSKYGRFAACPNYPKCKNTKSIDSDGHVIEKTAPKIYEGQKCELCGGNLVIRKGRAENFLACENYPKCKFTKSINKQTDHKCPACGGKLVMKRTKTQKTFYGCENYPKCNFASWYVPTDKKCPNCGNVLFYNKSKNLLCCQKENCGYTVEKTDDGE